MSNSSWLTDQRSGRVNLDRPVRSLADRAADLLAGRNVEESHGSPSSSGSTSATAPVPGRCSAGTRGPPARVRRHTGRRRPGPRCAGAGATDDDRSPARLADPGAALLGRRSIVGDDPVVRSRLIGSPSTTAYSAAIELTKVGSDTRCCRARGRWHQSMRSIPCIEHRLLGLHSRRPSDRLRASRAGFQVLGAVRSRSADRCARIRFLDRCHRDLGLPLRLGGLVTARRCCRSPRPRPRGRLPAAARRRLRAHRANAILRQFPLRLLPGGLDVGLAGVRRSQ